MYPSGYISGKSSSSIFLNTSTFFSELFLDSFFDSFLDGLDVFNFGVSKVPKVVNEFSEHLNLIIDDIDYFVFHQANKFMNDKIKIYY